MERRIDSCATPAASVRRHQALEANRSTRLFIQLCPVYEHGTVRCSPVTGHDSRSSHPPSPKGMETSTYAGPAGQDRLERGLDFGCWAGGTCASDVDRSSLGRWRLLRTRSRPATVTARRRGRAVGTARGLSAASPSPAPCAGARPIAKRSRRSARTRPGGCGAARDRGALGSSNTSITAKTSSRTGGEGNPERPRGARGTRQEHPGAHPVGADSSGSTSRSPDAAAMSRRVTVDHPRPEAELPMRPERTELVLRSGPHVDTARRPRRTRRASRGPCSQTRGSAP